MKTDKVTFCYLENEYIISKWIVDSLNKVGVTFNDNYFKYLISNSSPYDKFNDSNVIQLLAIRDFYNRFFYSCGKGLGRIIKYKDGKIVNYYSSLYDVVADGELDNEFGFEKLDQKGIKPLFTKYNFYGCYLTIDNSHPYLAAINEFVKDIKCKIAKLNKSSYISNKTDLNKSYSTKEYKEQLIKIKNLSGLPNFDIKYYTFSIIRII